jgi:hypothetical protein
MDQVSPSDEDVEGFIKFYDAFISDALDNRMSTDHWIAIWNSYKHDDDVQEAEENGIVMGKNQKIVAQKASKEEEKNLLPEAGAGAGVKPKEKPRSFGGEFFKGVI